VINRAINENNDRMVASKESMADVQDGQALANLDSALLAGRYCKVLGHCLARALGETTAKERLMLLWRYDQNLQLGEIGRLMGIHQSNVTRQLLRLQEKLRLAIIEALGSQYHLSSSAIQECLADVVDNPQTSVSLMTLITETLSRANIPVADSDPAGTYVQAHRPPRPAGSESNSNEAAS
jgi:hypothetical protein